MTPCLAGLNILGLPLSTLPLGWLATRSAVVLPAACAWAGQPRGQRRAAAGCFFSSSRVRIELSHHTALRPAALRRAAARRAAAALTWLT